MVGMRLGGLSCWEVGVASGGCGCCWVGVGLPMGCWVAGLLAGLLACWLVHAGYKKMRGWRVEGGGWILVQVDFEIKKQRRVFIY
jgi:hypothetical protein